MKPPPKKSEQYANNVISENAAKNSNNKIIVETEENLKGVVIWGEIYLRYFHRRAQA